MDGSRPDSCIVLPCPCRNWNRCSVALQEQGEDYDNRCSAHGMDAVLCRKGICWMRIQLRNGFPEDSKCLSLVCLSACGVQPFMYIRMVDQGRTRILRMLRGIAGYIPDDKWYEPASSVSPYRYIPESRSVFRLPYDGIRHLCFYPVGMQWRGNPLEETSFLSGDVFRYRQICKAGVCAYGRHAADCDSASSHMEPCRLCQYSRRDVAGVEKILLEISLCSMDIGGGDVRKSLLPEARFR